jgi:hypothetical protein
VCVAVLGVGYCYSSAVQWRLRSALRRGTWRGWWQAAHAAGQQVSALGSLQHEAADGASHHAPTTPSPRPAGKLRVVAKVLEHWQEAGHKALVFTQVSGGSSLGWQRLVRQGACALRCEWLLGLLGHEAGPSSHTSRRLRSRLAPQQHRSSSASSVRSNAGGAAHSPTRAAAPAAPPPAADAADAGHPAEACCGAGLEPPPHGRLHQHSAALQVGCLLAGLGWVVGGGDFAGGCLGRCACCAPLLLLRAAVGGSIVEVVVVAGATTRGGLYWWRQQGGPTRSRHAGPTADPPLAAPPTG